MARVSGQPITTTLMIEFTDSTSSVTTRANADTTPVFKVYLSGTLITTIQGTDITQSGTGVYIATWTPSAPGQYKVIWTFAVSNIDYTQDEDIYVLDAAITSVTPTDEPDIGGGNVCTVTGTFIGADGDYVQGVVVKFSPITAQSEHTSFGFICSDASAETSATGYLALDVVRGAYGLLTISRAGIVRRVTIPDAATVDVFDLAASGDDLLEVQTPQFYTLPRRS